MQHSTQPYALVIVAHPDDESYLVAGTCLKLAAEQKNITVICATRGEKGDSKLEKTVTKQEVAQIRDRELCDACELLKVNDVEFLNFEDGNLKNDFEKIISQLTEKIQEYNPEIIITFGPEGITGHMDHITIGQATMSAIQKLKNKPKQAWLISLPRSIMPDFNLMLKKSRVHHSHYAPTQLEGVLDEKLTKIDIKKYGQDKLKAIQIHKSQGLPVWIRTHMPQLGEMFLSYEFFEIIDLK